MFALLKGLVIKLSKYSSILSNVGESPYCHIKQAHLQQVLLRNGLMLYKTLRTMVYKFKCLISDFTRRDDKDIRKSLHDLSQVKRTSSVKPAPMRAQHSIPIQTPQKDGTTAKTVLVKKFNKQMWRPPVGSPEGSDQRPFSPFGGTLPPSKINKKKVHEVFVWGEWRHLVKYSNP